MPAGLEPSSATLQNISEYFLTELNPSGQLFAVVAPLGLNLLTPFCYRRAWNKDNTMGGSGGTPPDAHLAFKMLSIFAVCLALRE